MNETFTIAPINNQRKFVRVPYKEAVQFQTKDQRVFGGCLSQDLSEGGIRVNFNEFVPLDTELMLQVKLNTGELAETMGKVVWVSKLPHTEKYQLGLQFEKLEASPASQRLIHKALNPIDKW